MRTYLTEDEIPAYCGLISGVKMEHIEAATTLIDAYKGRSFFPMKHTERVELKHNRVDHEFRGKLKHFPRVSIEKITAKTHSCFGNDVLTLDASTLDFDDDESLYFTFEFPQSFMFRKPPKAIKVTYTSGYNEIPESIKRACGILACNIKQMGGTLRWKSRDDYDVKVTLSDSGVFSPEIEDILRGVEIQ